MRMLLPVRVRSRSMWCFSRTFSVTLMASRKFPRAALAGTPRERGGGREGGRERRKAHK